MTLVNLLTNYFKDEGPVAAVLDSENPDISGVYQVMIDELHKLPSDLNNIVIVPVWNALYNSGRNQRKPWVHECQPYFVFELLTHNGFALQHQAYTCEVDELIERVGDRVFLQEGFLEVLTKMDAQLGQHVYQPLINFNDELRASYSALKRYMEEDVETTVQDAINQGIEAYNQKLAQYKTEFLAKERAKRAVKDVQTVTSPTTTQQVEDFLYPEGVPTPNETYTYPKEMTDEQLATALKTGNEVLQERLSKGSKPKLALLAIYRQLLTEDQDYRKDLKGLIHRIEKGD